MSGRARPRVIVGINDGHNASAALLVDGRLVAAVQEERLTRVKNQWGMPNGSIDEVLRIGGLDRGDVDAFAVATSHHDRYYAFDRESIRARYAQGTSLVRRGLRRVPFLMRLRKQQMLARRPKMLIAAGLPADRIVLVEHHEAHGAAAYWASPMRGDDVLVLTADGYGDYIGATVSVMRSGRLSRIAAVPAAYSLGQLYANVTHLLGMVPLEHEYKVMGLAPYAYRDREAVGRVKGRFDRLFHFESDGLSWRTTGGRSMLDGADSVASEIRHERFDVAAAGTQLFLEEFLAQWARHAVAATGLRRVAVGGGVFLNVKLNQRLASDPGIEQLFVMPSAGDETNALGAAYWTAAQASTEIEPLAHLYLGRDLGPKEQWRSALAGAGGGLHVREDGEPDGAVVDLLAQGEVVARVVGRSEFGARALGHRSVLADPSKRDVRDVINDMIKERDFWMPFAPAVLSSHVDEYVTKPRSTDARFMTVAFDSRPEARGRLAAALHPADHTARIQEVDAQTAPDFHRLLERWHERTGNAALLNTSYNLHGSPIVDSAEDAIDVFMRSGLRHLQLGQVLVSKA